MAKETSKEVKTTGTVENKAEVTQEPVQAPRKGTKVLTEAVYSVKELAANARKLFGTRQECVTAALKAAGKSECTIAEAKEIVGRFLKKEVR